jgi:hypothetical protein
VTVRELIEALSVFDPDAEVSIEGEVDGNFWEPTPGQINGGVIL